jgi:hypothetical protein
MKKLVEELKKIVRFKDTTEAGDHVLIASKNPREMIYAIVESIDRDPRRKDEWWLVRMRLLSLPPQNIVWTLREPQFAGKEIFTMQGVEHFMKAIVLDDGKENPPAEGSTSSAAKKNTGKKQNPFHIVK